MTGVNILCYFVSSFSLTNGPPWVSNAHSSHVRSQCSVLAQSLQTVMYSTISHDYLLRLENVAVGQLVSRQTNETSLVRILRISSDRRDLLSRPDLLLAGAATRSFRPTPPLSMHFVCNSNRTTSVSLMSACTCLLCCTVRHLGRDGFLRLPILQCTLLRRRRRRRQMTDKGTTVRRR